MKPVKYPAGVQFEVTPECNHNCIHCYNYWRSEYEPTANVVSRDKLCLIARKIADLRPTHVVLTGGEPLLEFDNLKSVVPIIKESKCTHVSVNTNATLVDEEVASFFSKYSMSAFVSLPCSDSGICDSITSVHGSLDRITKGIRLLRSYDIPVAVNMVVSSLNSHKVYDTAKYALENLGINRFFVSPVSKPINAEFGFDKYMLSKRDLTFLTDTLLDISNSLEIQTDFSVSLPYCAFTTQEQSDSFSYRKHCTAGKFTYSVNYEGDVKACPRDSKSYGNLLEEAFGAIWGRMSEWRDDSLLPVECLKCNSKRSCGGGCRLEGYADAGSRDSLDWRANLDFAPLRFARIIPTYPFSDTQRFTVDRNVYRVIEPVGVRISVGTQFIYITPHLNAFLSDGADFTVEEMCSEFPNATIEETKEIIRSLIQINVLRPI